MANQSIWFDCKIISQKSQNNQKTKIGHFRLEYYLKAD